MKASNETGGPCVADPDQSRSSGTSPQVDMHGPRVARIAPRNSGARAIGGDAAACVDAPGGLTTNSPPPKVKPWVQDEPKVLSTGFDGLKIALELDWKQRNFLDLLENQKSLCSSLNKDLPVLLKTSDGKEFNFLLKPHGAGGYAYLLLGKEFSIKLLQSLEQKGTRPSAMVEVRAEALWQFGPSAAVQFILDAFIAQGAEIKTAKPSRVDLCMDLLLSDESWIPTLAEFAATRATSKSYYEVNSRFSGFLFGKGKLLARVYDKGLEVETKSGKNWFFDIWGFPAVPEGKKIIRVEFQLRREALKELGQEDVWDPFIQCGRLWAYCTHEWLKFQSNPGKHHTQRKTLPWWRVVQDGFAGLQGESPAVRMKANKADQKQLAAQAVGLVTSLLALESGFTRKMLDHLSYEDLFAAFERCIVCSGKELKAIHADLQQKIGKKRVELPESENAECWLTEKSTLTSSFLRRLNAPLIPKEART